MKTSLFPSDQKNFAKFLAARSVPDKLLQEKKNTNTNVIVATNKKAH